MSILHRLALLAGAKAEDAINKAEDPETSLDYACSLAMQQLQGAREGLAKMAAARQRVVQQDQKLASEEAQLGNQARRALAAGREDLAREAAQRITVIRTTRAPIQEQLGQLEQQQTNLEAAVKQLEQQVGALQTKKEVLKAQFAAGTAASEVNDSLAGIGVHMEDVNGAFTRAQDRVSQVTARADATHSLIESGALNTPLGGGPSDHIEAELAKAGAGSVDDVLAQFRSAPAIPTTSTPPALPAGEPANKLDESGNNDMAGWI